MTCTTNANNIITSDILPLEFEIDYKTNTYNKIENGVGKGFMQEYPYYNCEYYWNNNKGGLYRRIVDCNSYARAAYSETPVVKPFINPIKVKMDLVTKNYKKDILKYNPVPDNIYILYDKNINTNYDLNKKKTKTRIIKRKHRQNKKNKPDKHYKLLNEQFPNNLDGEDDEDSEEDEDIEDDEDSGNYENWDEYLHRPHHPNYYTRCRGPYNESYSRCIGFCCN
jgi:hypothetical protein